MSYLVDCVEKGLESELILVEQASSDMAVQARNRMSQAILEIKPIELDIRRAEIPEVLSNKELQSIVAALGVGINVIPGMNMLRIESIRYGKVILALEPSARNQVVEFLKRFMGPVLEGGFVYETDSAANVFASGDRMLVQVAGGER